MDNANVVIASYINGLGIDNKLRVQDSSGVQYFLADHLGSTNALTNTTGTITSSATYDSFGNPTGNLSTRYKYTGREFDSDIDLYYYRARFYNAEIGRFISEDPIGFAGGDVNLYGYVGNQSLKFVDPMGQQADATFARHGIPSSSPKRKPNRNLDCVPEKCKKQIQQMLRQLEYTRKTLEKNNNRVPNSSGAWNNFRATTNAVGNYLSKKFGASKPPFSPFLGCQDQALCLLDNSARKQAIDTPNYTFDIAHDFIGLRDVNPEKFDLGPFRFTTHKWVKATSILSDCPDVRLDVWDNSWELIN